MAKGPTPFKAPAAYQTPPQPAGTAGAAPSPSSWPIAGDVADLLAIVQGQTETMEQQEALLHAYQTNLNNAQAVVGTPATGNATSTGNQLAVTTVVGVIKNGSTLTDGPAVPAGTTVLGQISGTAGGAGTYLTSAATTCSSTPVTFTPPTTEANWPTPQDQVTLNLLVQQQTAVIRVQTALIQHYQDVLNTSQTASPPTGP